MRRYKAVRPSSSSSNIVTAGDSDVTVGVREGFALRFVGHVMRATFSPIGPKSLVPQEGTKFCVESRTTLHPTQGRAIWGGMQVTS